MYRCHSHANPAHNLTRPPSYIRQTCGAARASADSPIAAVERRVERRVDPDADADADADADPDADPNVHIRDAEVHGPSHGTRGVEGDAARAPRRKLGSAARIGL